MTAGVVNINDVLDGHVALEIECVDRLYLNAYVPGLQVPGQVARFLHDHRGLMLPSPAAFEKIGNRFRGAVRRFAEDRGVPILRLKKPDRTRWDDRKLDHVRPYLQSAEDSGRFGVVAIVAAQEFQWVFSARQSRGGEGFPFTFFKEQRRVGVYYFYVLDPDFGAGFIKICTCFPYPAKVWVNGHEWAKRQATFAGISFRALANGFAACDQPDALQAICDRFGPDDVQGFFDRWIATIPTPFTKVDRDAGYWWELSVRQVEASRTLVFDDPRRARGFFESLVSDNIGIGRPHEVAVVFGRRVTRRTPGIFRTRVFGARTEVTVEFRYKHSRVKQYLKEGRALRPRPRPRRLHQQKPSRARRRVARAGLHPQPDDLRPAPAPSPRAHRTTTPSNTYVLTPAGTRVAVFYNKIHGRLLRPLIAAADQPPAPIELRRALATIDRTISDYADNARLAPAA